MSIFDIFRIFDMPRHSNASRLLDQIERSRLLELDRNRLQAELDRKSAMPGDHRYWEGRYRDEAARNEKLIDAIQGRVFELQNLQSEINGCVFQIEEIAVEIQGDINAG